MTEETNIEQAAPQGGQAPTERPSTTEELLAELHQRVAHLEAAFHASMSHLGHGHPIVVNWVKRVKARIAAALGGTPTPPAPPEVPKESEDGSV